MCWCCCCWGCYLFTCVRLLRAFPFSLVCWDLSFLFVYFFQRRFFFFFLAFCKTLNPHPNLPNLLFLFLVTSKSAHRSSINLRNAFDSIVLPRVERATKETSKGDLTHFRTTTNAHAHERIKKYVCAKSFDFDLVCFLFFGFNYQKVKREKKWLFWEALSLRVLVVFEKKRAIERPFTFFRSSRFGFFLLVSIGESRSVGAVWWSWWWRRWWW